MFRCALLSISAVFISVTALLAEDPKAAEARHSLETRASELEKRAAEAESADHHDEARKLRQEALEIRTRLHGPKHWKVTDARLALEQAEALARFKPEQHATIVEGATLVMKASEMAKSGKVRDAIPLARRGVELTRSVLGEKHRITAIYVRFQGLLYHQAGDQAAAQPYLENTLNLMRQVFGEDHPEMAQSYDAAAMNLIAWGKYGDAEPHIRRALAVRKNVFGEEHPDTAANHNALGNNLSLQGKYAASEKEYRLALNIYKKVRGPEHRDTAESLDHLGQSLSFQSKVTEAEPLLERALAIRRNVLGESHPDTALSYLNLAGNRDEQGRYVDAEPLYRRALAIQEKTLGKTDFLTAKTRQHLAGNLDNQGRERDAEPLHRQALAVIEKAFGPMHPGTARSYSDLAVNLVAQAKYAEAEKLLRKALEIEQKVLGEDHPSTATSYNNLAMCLSDQSRYADAEPLVRKALDIYRKSLGEEHERTLMAYSNLGTNLQHQGRYADAEKLLRTALDLRRKTLGDDHPTTAGSYTNLAANLGAQARPAEAEALNRKALAIYRKALGEEHTLTLVAANNLATKLSDQGKYAEAEALYRRVLDLRRRLLGEQNADTATSYNNLASVLHHQHRSAEAELLQRKSLVIREKVLGKEHNLTAEAYSNLADILNADGKYAEGEGLLRQALAIRKKSPGENHPDTAITYLNLSVNLRMQARYAEAEPFCKTALERCRKSHGEEHPATAVAYINQAHNLYLQGHYKDAAPLYRTALEIKRKILGEEHPDTASGYVNVAIGQYALGHFADAEEAWVKAAKSFDVARLRLSTASLERAVFAGSISPWPALPACQARLGRFLDAWRSLEAGLARGLLDELSARAGQSLTEEQRRRQEILSNGLNQLDLQITTLLGAKEEKEPAGSRFQELIETRRKAEKEMAQLAAELAAREVYDLDRIQQHLPPDAAFVTWVDTKGQPGTADPNGEHWACVLRRRGTPAWVRLRGTGAQGAWTNDDNDLAIRFRQVISSRPGQMREDRAELTRRLYDQRLAPLETYLRAGDDLPAVRHLLVCPVWWMAGVPVEALADQYVISYVPSGTLLAKLAEKRQAASRPPQAKPRLLALGDPLFVHGQTSKQPETVLPGHGVLLAGVDSGSNADHSGLKEGDVLVSYAGTQVDSFKELANAIAAHATVNRLQSKADAGSISVVASRDGRMLTLTVRPGRLGVSVAPGTAAEAVQARRDGDRAVSASRGDTYGPLPGTRTEVQALAALFDQPLVLLGSAASEQRLDDLARKDELRQFRYLHFATHGQPNDQLALQSALILAQDDVSGLRQQALGDNYPYDGRLTAEEILRRWKLNADLVVLSACQSGLGKQAGGEGYLGFTHALFLAGARSLVISLWKVDDTSTALLMTRFYENLLGKRAGLKAPLSKDEALREAKYWLRTLTVEQRDQEVALRSERGSRVVSGPPRETAKPAHPYEHPYYWSPFILIGDPN